MQASRRLLKVVQSYQKNLHLLHLLRSLQERIAGGHTVLIPHINLLAQALQGQAKPQRGTDGIAIRPEMGSHTNGAALLNTG